MNWLKDMGIKNKILLIPAVAIIGFMVFLMVIITNGSKNADRLDEIKDSYFPVLELANSNIVILERMNELMINAASTGEQEMLDTAKKMSNEMSENLRQQGKLQAQQRGQVNDIERYLQSFGDISFKLTQSMIDGTMDFSRIAEIAANKQKNYETLESSLKVFRDQSHKSFTATVNQALETERDNLTLGIIICVITVVLILAISFGVALIVTNNIEKIVQSLKDIAQGEGDLTRRLEQTSNDELGTLVEWFNVFVNKLHVTIGDVVEVISPLTNVSQELNSLSAQNSELSTEQSNSSELVTNAMNDMLRSVTNVAENAGSAASAADDADKEAKQGLEIVTSTVTSIEDLAAAVERAAEVIVNLNPTLKVLAAFLMLLRASPNRPTFWR